MQFNLEVFAALQTLRHYAENDFERHRIDLLENDLTNPPRVQILDNKHQRFNGVTFRKRKTGHYFTPMYSIYRAVYQYYYGEVPPKTIIHHIDQNKDNNNIENLLPMFPADHRKLHAKLCRSLKIPVKEKSKRKPKPKPIISKTCLWCGKPFETRNPKKKCCSASCVNRLRFFEKTGKTKATALRTCIVCGKQFEVTTSHRNKDLPRDRLTCSDECLQKIRKLPTPAVEKICPVCGKHFKNTKHPEAKTCSPECTTKLRKQLHWRKSVCENCGKEFEVRRSAIGRFCSQKCLLEYMSKVRHPTSPQQNLF